MSKTANTMSFNRYMVECESILTAQQLSEILVLIDTWWNVNAVKSILNLHSVNRFNRYMVECESNKSSWKSVVWWSFNRYMVECELLQ